MEPEPEATVDFTLPAAAENVPLLRHAVAGLAEALEMEGPAIADLKTVLTEACMNVVTHAYGDGTGPLEVSAGVAGGHLVLTVRDYGQGVRPLADVERRSLRLGLPLIAALTDSFEIRGGSGGRGTTVRMRMAINSDGDGEERGGEPPDVRDTQISAPAGELLAPVLSRVVSMFAARANFSVDRLSDAVLLSDAISAQGPGGFPDGRARISVSEAEGRFTVRIGPLDEGGGERLVEGLRIPELDASLKTLADDVRVEGSDGGEQVVIELGRPG